MPNSLTPRRAFPPASSVVYIEGDGNYSRLHLMGQQTLYYSWTLLRYQRYYPDFIRISKGLLINPHFVKSAYIERPIDKTPYCRIQMTGRDLLTSSKRQTKQIYQLLTLKHERN